jgi:genome maintenance exonuclease 1
MSQETLTINGKRYYPVESEGNIYYLPSVTTILGATGDKSGLDAWKEKVGHDKAAEISKFSANRGTLMHYHLEMFLTSTKESKKEKLQEALKLTHEYSKENGFTSEELANGRKLFFNFYMNGDLDRVKRVIMHEARLFSLRGGGYAGRVDDIFEDLEDLMVVADYKSSKKPKKDEWIEDYKLQISAYYVAYWDMFGVVPHRAEIWISNEMDDIPQKFILHKEDIKLYYSKFIDRVKQYHEMYPLPPEYIKK